MMCKYFSWLTGLLISLFAFAQSPAERLIQAEKNFAAYSVANGTKEAFLQFLDSSGVVFNDGKAVNGINFWNKRERRPGILNWRPEYAAISLQGDLGFTTGPWTFQQTLQDTILARGSFMTVWHINSRGEWKFLADLGAGNSPVNPDTSITILEQTHHGRSSLNALLNAEKKFIENSGDPMKVYKKFLAPNAVLNRNGRRPQQASWDLTLFPNSVQYTVTGYGISSSGDLGYVYGTTIIDGKTDNYLRIWRYENRQWKIMAEVLRY